MAATRRGCVTPMRPLRSGKVAGAKAALKEELRHLRRLAAARFAAEHDYVASGNGFHDLLLVADDREVLPPLLHCLRPLHLNKLGVPGVHCATEQQQSLAGTRGTCVVSFCYRVSLSVCLSVLLSVSLCLSDRQTD